MMMMKMNHDNEKKLGGPIISRPFVQLDKGRRAPPGAHQSSQGKELSVGGREGNLLAQIVN